MSGISAVLIGWAPHPGGRFSAERSAEAGADFLPAPPARSPLVAPSGIGATEVAAVMLLCRSSAISSNESRLRLPMPGFDTPLLLWLGVRCDGIFAWVGSSDVLSSS